MMTINTRKIMINILTKRTALKRLTSSALIFTSLLFGGCTTLQQDALYTDVISFARGHAGLEVKTAPAGDVVLTYMERQSVNIENPETLVLLHGFSANKDNWILFTRALDEKFHIIAIDLAGHGDSEKLLTTDYTLITQAERLNTFLTGLGIDEFHIAGNSMGGAISAIFTINHPNKVKSLTLIDSAGVNGQQKSEYFDILEKGSNPLIAKDEDSFEFRMDFTMSQPPFLPWPLRPALLRQAITRADINEKIFNDIILTIPLLEKTNFQQSLQTTIAEHKLPTLIMWGKEDRVLNVSDVAAFKEIIPNAKVHIFENVGHLPMVEVPSESAEIYQEFLSSIP